MPKPDWANPQARSAAWVALAGAILFMLGLAYAAWQRASAASCWDPTLGWRCSQSAGSDALLLANVATVMAFVGLGMALVAGFVAVRRATDPRRRMVLPAAVPAVSAYPCPRCRQVLTWSTVDGRWYCPWCGLLA